MPVIEVNDVRLNCVQIDDESGDGHEDLVMVHGLATNFSFWYLPHAVTFSKRFRVTLYDLRGHGRSGMPETGYSPTNMATDLEKLLDHFDIQRAHFVAHSFGGLVTLNLARYNPERFASLILADTSIPSILLPHEFRKWPMGKKIRKMLKRYGIDFNIEAHAETPHLGYRLFNAMADLQARNIGIPADLSALLGPFAERHNVRTTQKWLQLIETTRARYELTGGNHLSSDCLMQMKIPTLAMYGELSHAMVTGEKLQHIWPHAYFRKISHAGHFFPVTRPDDFIMSCENFWRLVLDADTGTIFSIPHEMKSGTKECNI